MYSIIESKNSTVLVASFHQLVDSIIQSNSFYLYPMIHTTMPSGSVSPTSSIDSSNYSSIDSVSTNSFDKSELNRQVNRQAKKLERPSEKIQVDVSQCMLKSARILSKNPNKVIVCTFCKNNGEPEDIYRSHSIKDVRGRVTCPLLKEYVCPSCGESGENAHTITYCKKLKAQKRNELISKSLN